ncbi:MAG: AmmeMemoRadiSam system radical SAM enzyme [Thermoplasmatales archaeon B_DKE]|nr:MAG: AmmeMemoRadiSam system radical SAM enzyme [Thermoplasmatales archaeon B_DKE]
MKEAVLYSEIGDGRVKCTACWRYCILKPEQTGFCGVRTNIGGKLYLSVYGLVSAMHVDPIEKKPVLHMFPNSRILSLSTTGCNYACAYCQNWDISQRRKAEGTEISPEDVVDEALRLKCRGIAYTYNEPTIFMEFAHDIGVIARKKGLINIFVTNGFETDESISMARDFLTAATVDFKGNAGTQFYRKYISVPSAEPIYATLEGLKKAGIHLEITDLVLPGIGDNTDELRTMLGRILDSVGNAVPIEFLRFHPDFKLQDLPQTPVRTLEQHHDIALEMGFKYSYVGNVPGHRFENTYCPGCGRVVVERNIFRTTKIMLTTDGKCVYCGYDTGIILDDGKPASLAGIYEA